MDRVEKIKKERGEDFFAVNGSKGGKAKVPKGVAVNGRAAEIGRLGGLARAKKIRESKS